MFRPWKKIKSWSYCNSLYYRVYQIIAFQIIARSKLSRLERGVAIKWCNGHAIIWCTLKFGARENLVSMTKIWEFPENPRKYCSFGDFFAFSTVQILTAHRKKQQGIFLSAHRNNLVKERKKSMGYKCVSIALDFPLEFRDFFCIHYSGNTKGHENKNQGMFLNIQRKILVKKNNIYKPCRSGK